MLQRGIVQELSGSKAKIAVGGGEGCSACNSRESCMSITGKSPEAKIISVENTLNASTGDAVELELPVSSTMKVIALTFLLPVGMLVAGYWVMMPAGSTQGALGAVGGFSLGMIIALFANRAMAGKKEYQMRMTAITEKNCIETDVPK